MKYWRALIKVIGLMNDSLWANAEAPRSGPRAFWNTGRAIHPAIYKWHQLFPGCGLSGLYPIQGSCGYFYKHKHTWSSKGKTGSPSLRDFFNSTFNSSPVRIEWMDQDEKWLQGFGVRNSRFLLRSTVNLDLRKSQDSGVQPPLNSVDPP